ERGGDWRRAVGDGARRVRDIGEGGLGGGGEAPPLVRGEVEWSEVRRAAAKAGERPVVEAAPDVAAGLERRHPGDARWRSALQMLVEERDQHALAEPAGGVDAP